MSTESRKPGKRDFWPDPPNSPPVKGVELSSMSMDQLEEILKIEKASFPAPWTRESFEYDLTSNNLAHYWVIADGGEIIGYSGIWLIGKIAHITTLCIRSDHRGKDLGKWLLLKTMQMGGEMGAERFTLEVREGNLAARKLYESTGYRAVGRRANYYHEIGEDAVVMWTGNPPYED